MVEIVYKGGAAPAAPATGQRQYSYKLPRQETAPTDEHEWADIPRAIAADAGSLLTMAGGATEFLGKYNPMLQFTGWLRGDEDPEKELGTGMRKLGGEISEEWVSRMSLAGQESKAKDYLGEGPSAITDPWAVGLHVAGALPSIAASLTPIGVAAYAGLGARALMALGAVTEGAMVSGSVVSEALSAFDGMTDEQLKSRPGFDEIQADYPQLSAADLRREMRDYITNKAGVTGGTIGVATGSLGGYLMGKLFSGKALSKTAVGEYLGQPATTRRGVAARALPVGAMQEGFQEGSEQAGANWVLGKPSACTRMGS